MTTDATQGQRWARRRAHERLRLASSAGAMHPDGGEDEGCSEEEDVVTALLVSHAETLDALRADFDREAVFAPRDRDVPFNAKRPVYPGAACGGGSRCESCPRWRCTRCRKLRPWCFGVSDEHPRWCDACVSQHPKRKCRACRRASKPAKPAETGGAK